MNLGEAEVLLAQKLSCGEPRVRKKAFYRLEQRINAQSAKNEFTSKDDFLKLWKGLYYCFWLQDKPLLQEELVDNITKLIDSIRDKNQKLLFIEAFYEEVGKEWKSVDQWRMDKYLMFFRRIFRRTLAWLKSVKFNEEDINSVLDILGRLMQNSQIDSYPIGLKLHLVSIYLDEVDNVGAEQLDVECINIFLKPYFNLLGEKSINDIYFNAILNEIFTLILEYCINNLEMPEVEREGTSEPRLAFDLQKIRDELFNVGKSKSLVAKRRAKIYALVSKYDTLISGSNPFDVEISDVEDLSDSEVDKAVNGFLKSEAADKKKAKRKNVVKRNKRKCLSDDEDCLGKQEEKKKQNKMKVTKIKNKFKTKKSKP